MCGIVAILNVREQTHELREKALKMSQKIRHRGPDWSGIYCGGSAILAHERLSIVDPESGGQPLYSPRPLEGDGGGLQVLAVNGEIYNHQEIRRRYAGQYEFQTGSDCEVILALYREWRSQLSALSLQPSALSPQPSALSPQPSALSPQPSPRSSRQLSRLKTTFQQVQHIS